VRVLLSGPRAAGRRLGFGFVLLCVLAVSCGEADVPVAVDDFTARVDESQYIYEELTEAERNCVFRREAAELDVDLIINGIGEAGDAERTKAVRIGLECVEDPTSWDSWIQLQADSFAAGIGQGVVFAEDEGKCLVVHALENSTDAARLFAVGDRPTDIDVLLEGANLCLTEDNLALLYGEQVAFNEYGDDPALDALYDDCGARGEAACDLLYLLSGQGSDYATYGESCGGTIDLGGDWCSGVQVDAEGFAIPDSEGFLAIREACAVGDAVSCDLVYGLSAFGSDDETFGFTCGERFPLGANPDCRTSMAGS